MVLHIFIPFSLERGRIACNAEHCNTYRAIPSVCLSITRWVPYPDE